MKYPVPSYAFVASLFAAALLLSACADRAAELRRELSAHLAAGDYALAGEAVRNLVLLSIESAEDTTDYAGGVH